MNEKLAAKIDKALDEKVVRMRKFWPFWKKIVFGFNFIFNHNHYIYLKDHEVEWDSAPERYAENVEIIKANKEKIYQIDK